MRLPLFLSLLPLLMTQTTPPAGDPPANDPPATDPPKADPEPEDVSGLKSALEKERTKRKQYETDLKAAREAQDELDRLKADAKKKADDEAAEQGKYKELLEKRDAEIADLKAQLTQRDRDALRASIARKHQLPDDAVKYLTGDDEASIEESAKDLARLTARAEDVDTDSGKPNANRGGGNQTKSVLANYEFGKRR